VIRLQASVVRNDFANVLRSVKKGERILLSKHDKGVAALVSVEDLAILEAIEDKRDVLAARKGIIDAETNGTVPWETVKAQLGL
jgi:prevent-host-death family protein